MENTSGIYLGIDTALGETSLAISRAGQVVAEFHSAERDRQATMLRVWIEALLAQAGVEYGELKTIAACVGPGGFTGIRIGLAMARGIGFASERPVVGYSSLRLMAYGAPPHEAPLQVVLPAGRSQLYVQSFGRDASPLAPPRLVEKAELRTAPCQVSTVAEYVSHATMLHQPARHACLLVEMLAAGMAPDMPHAPVPLYIKPADATPQQPFLEMLKSSQAP